MVLDVPWHFGTYSLEQGRGVVTAPGTAWTRDKGVSEEASAKDPSMLLLYLRPRGSSSGFTAPLDSTEGFHRGSICLDCALGERNECEFFSNSRSHDSL